MRGMPAAMGQKRAVLVGINYPGRDNELKGCFNDVTRMRRCLIERFGFSEADIRVLADADPSTPAPTGANIRQELEWLVGDARLGDTLFFHYSGHGMQLPAETGEDDDTGYDECIVPCDGNLIEGQDSREGCQESPHPKKMRPRFQGTRGKSPRWLHLHHSFRLVPQWRADRQGQGADWEQHSAEENRAPGASHAASFRCLPPTDGPWRVRFTRHPPSSTRLATDQPQPRPKWRSRDEHEGRGKHTRQHQKPVTASLGVHQDAPGDHRQGRRRRGHDSDDAVPSLRRRREPKIKKFVQVMAGKLRQDGKLEGNEAGQVDTLDRALEQEVHGDGGVKEVYTGTTASAPPLPLNGVLISGCQTDQTSGDATTAEGVSYGLLSNAVQTILARKHDGTVTNRELVLKARELLSKQGVTTQQPGLYCSDEHASLAFIC